MYKNLLIAVDIAPQSQKLLARGCELARLFNASVHVIYVEPGVGDHSLEEIELGLEEIHERTMIMRRAQLHELCRELTPAPATQTVTCGDVIQHILVCAEEVKADLMVMGEHHSFWHLQHTNRAVQKRFKGDLLTLSLDENGG